MSSKEIAISVRNLSKSYTIAHNAAKHSTMGEALMHRLKNPIQRTEKETFWALKDVSFDIQKGDVVGIIGRNGAGKSTLLKVLSRITEPTSGKAIMNGRVGSLLEVGTGFHPELTGRENIYMNGAILGMTKREIAKHFDAIVDFAGVEQFLDTPVKRYSSGMYVRLAFAVAAHLHPEILIIDEVLAVGDATFQKKCLGKMQNVAQSGRSVLFVSHNMAAVRQLCNKGIVLNSGQMVFTGDVGECSKLYMDMGTNPGGSILKKVHVKHHGLKIASVSVNGCYDDHINVSSNDKILEVEITGTLSQALPIELEALLMDEFETRLAFFSPGHERGYTDCHPSGDFKITRQIELPMRMNRGNYILSMSLTEPGVNGWADIPHALLISTEGTPTETGRILDYQSGGGWLFLTEPKYPKSSDLFELSARNPSPTTVVPN